MEIPVQAASSTPHVSPIVRLISLHVLLDVTKRILIDVHTKKTSISLRYHLLDQMTAVFEDNNFKCIFLNENFWISIKDSLKFVPSSSIDNNTALVEIMACRRTGDEPLSKLMMS